MSGCFQSHCCRPSSASEYTNPVGTSSRLRCGSRGAGARSPPQEPGSGARSCTSSYFRFLKATALTFGGRKPSGCFFAALPPINGQPQKFRLLYRNLMRFGHHDP